ncbi:rRNA adenine N-6-methyltransferase [Bienertia sinuspersici]
MSDLRNPLYLHPSDSPTSVSIEPLIGPSNYREWRRNMEIALASKCKLGFVTGTVTRDDSDPTKAEQWDTCNHMVIAWILGSTSE